MFRSTEVVVTLTQTLPANKLAGGAGVNAQVKGYMLGGRIPSGPTDVATITALRFDVETAADLANTITAGVRAQILSGVSDQLNKAATFGGVINVTFQTFIDRFSYATEASDRSLTAFGAAIADICGINAPKRIAYLFGGFTTTSITTIERFELSSDAKTTLTAVLATPRNGCVGVEAQSKAFVCGGNQSTLGGFTSAVDRFTFETEAIAASGLTLSTIRAFGGGWSTKDKGYYVGGNAGPTNIVQGITYDPEAIAVLTATIPASGGTGVVDGSTFNTPTAGYAT